MCGGTGDLGFFWGINEGLSPRVRGNRGDGGPDDDPGGSIPACAGEPQPVQLSAGQIGVYPRVCGGTSVNLLTVTQLFSCQ